MEDIWGGRNGAAILHHCLEYCRILLLIPVNRTSPAEDVRARVVWKWKCFSISSLSRSRQLIVPRQSSTYIFDCAKRFTHHRARFLYLDLLGGNKSTVSSIARVNTVLQLATVCVCYESPLSLEMNQKEVLEYCKYTYMHIDCVSISIRLYRIPPCRWTALMVTHLWTRGTKGVQKVLQLDHKEEWKCYKQHFIFQYNHRWVQHICDIYLADC